jgi:hypothetical protein
MMANLRRENIVGEVSSVKNSFSSWSNCMNASYCKFVSLRRYSCTLLIVPQMARNHRDCHRIPNPPIDHHLHSSMCLLWDVMLL